MHHIPQTSESRKDTDLATKSMKELEATNGSEDPVHRLRLLCLSRGVNGILELGRMLRKIDHGGREELTEDTFIRALREKGLELTDEDARQLFWSLDTDNHGSIKMTDFMEHVRVSY